MTEYLIQMAASLILSVVDGTIKNPEARARYRRVMTKIRDVLLIAYPLETFDAGTSRVPDADFVPGTMQTIQQMAESEEGVQEVAPESPKDESGVVADSEYPGERRKVHQIMIPERRGAAPPQAAQAPAAPDNLPTS